MLQTFSEDAVQREKYRLCEEFRRTQRGEVARRQRVELMLVQEQVGRQWERKAKEDAQIVIEQERKAKEQERKAKEQERKAKEQAQMVIEQERKAKKQEREAKESALLKIKKMEEKIILSLKKSGKSNEEITQWLKSNK